MLASNASVKQVGRTLSPRITARFTFSLESRRYPTMLAVFRPYPIEARPLEQYFNRLAIPEGRTCLRRPMYRGSAAIAAAASLGKFKKKKKFQTLR